MSDDRNTGLATGSTLIRRLDEVATQPKVTIGTIGNYWELLENTRELLRTIWEVFGTIRSYWDVLGTFREVLGTTRGRFGTFRKQDC